MPRFRSTAAFYANNTQYRAGQTFADSPANAQPGDAIWADLANSSSMSPALAPLDASARAVFNGSRFTGMATRIDGTNSTGG